LKTPKIREVLEAVNNIFSRRFTSTFPAGTYEPVKTYRGKPKYNPDICVGCGACAQVCPAKAIEIVDDKKTKKRTLTVKYTDCITCGQCEEKCIVDGGIKLTTDYLTATFSKTSVENFNSVEKEMLVCEHCGELIAPIDQIRWLIRRLGAYSYGHPTLIMMRQLDTGYPLASLKPKEITRREEFFEILCPKCRHTVVVKDAFE
jgi:hydrogenase-4 component H